METGLHYKKISSRVYRRSKAKAREVAETTVSFLVLTAPFCTKIIVSSHTFEKKLFEAALYN